MKYFIFAMFIDKCVKLFPKEVELYIHSCLIQINKIQNEFKATFQRMKAELCSPSLPYRFFIFRKRFEIGQIVL